MRRYQPESRLRNRLMGVEGSKTSIIDNIGVLIP